MNIFSIIKESLQQFPAVFKRAWLPLLILSLPFELVQQVLLEQASDTKATDSFRLTITVISIVFSFAETMFLLLITPQIIYHLRRGQPSAPVFGHLKKHFKYTVIETLRSFLWIMLGFLLIFPGIYFLVSYVFVPFVVQFDPNYDKGHVDALKQSKKLAKTHFASVFGLYVLVILLMLGIELALARWNIFVSPEIWILGMVVYISIEIITTYMLFTAYETCKKTEEI